MATAASCEAGQENKMQATYKKTGEVRSVDNPFKQTAMSGPAAAIRYASVISGATSGKQIE